MMLSKKMDLKEWLHYCESLHVQEIDLGLDRVSAVRQALHIHFDCPVIVVAGTNGKGSTCAMLESIYHCAGYKTGVFSSPHLICFEERCRIALDDVSGTSLEPYFEAVEKARFVAGENGLPVSLSYFEFTTLVILCFMSQQNLDVAILEVGLGGRLDAVNIIDNDCAVITSIGIDHVDYLGDTRECIAMEKAGIMRSGKPVVIGDPYPPQNMLDYAENLDVQLWQYGVHFKYEYTYGITDWSWQGRCSSLNHLPLPALVGEHQFLNASGVLAAVEALQGKLPVQQVSINQGLLQVQLSGRFQIIHTHPTLILDVGHNPHAATVLRSNLEQMDGYSRTFAVFGAMRDKDITGILELMLPVVDQWFFTDLPLPRAIHANELEKLAKGVSGVVNKPFISKTYVKPVQALEAAFKEAQETDRIIVFGSFYAVGGILEEGIPMLSKMQ